MGYKGLSGVSLQSFPELVADDVASWVRQSSESGHNWVVNNDEQGPNGFGVKPDVNDTSHTTIRKDILWSVLMHGGGGVEYYFGYSYSNSDLTCQDYRSRENIWKMTRYAIDFFQLNGIPFWNMITANNLISNNVVNSFIVAPDNTTSVLYLKNGGEEMINLSLIPPGKTYNIFWYDPIAGGTFQRGSKSTIVSGTVGNTGLAPSKQNLQDWVVCLKQI